MAAEPLISACETRTVDVVPYEQRIGAALRGVLTELARLRLHGFTDVRLPVHCVCTNSVIDLPHGGALVPCVRMHSARCSQVSWLQHGCKLLPKLPFQRQRYLSAEASLLASKWWSTDSRTAACRESSR